jgi:hypothetical protein
MTRRLQLQANVARSLLRYDAESGLLKWLVDRPGVPVGSVAGYRKRCGYVAVKIFGRAYLAHRLVWLIVHGYMPDQLDHRNMDRADNRIKNLRIATGTLNCANKPAMSNNKSGLKGVSRYRGRYRATIFVDGTQRHLGMFGSAAEAHAAYAAAANSAFGEFARA